MLSDDIKEELVRGLTEIFQRNMSAIILYNPLLPDILIKWKDSFPFLHILFLYIYNGKDSFMADIHVRCPTFKNGDFR